MTMREKALCWLRTAIGNPSEETYQTKVMKEISAGIVEPSEEIFNKSAINPTVQITIGEGGEQVY